MSPFACVRALLERICHKTVWLKETDNDDDNGYDTSRTV